VIYFQLVVAVVYFALVTQALRHFDFVVEVVVGAQRVLPLLLPE
jgi:hypothetical protein